MSSSNSQDRDICEVMEQLRQQWLGAVYTAIPAAVTSYNPATQLAEVQPLVMRLRTLPNGDEVTEPEPVVPGVPVMWRGSVDGTYAETFPLAPGDTGMLWHCHGSIDRWRGLGGANPVDPDDDRRHDLSDGVFSPGLRSVPNALLSYATDAWVIAAPKVRLGSTDANGDVVVQSALDDFLAALTTAASTDTSGALAKLKTALQALNLGVGWKAGTTKTKAE